jgi:hypothetical protein
MPVTRGNVLLLLLLLLIIIIIIILIIILKSSNSLIFSTSGSESKLPKQSERRLRESTIRQIPKIRELPGCGV